MLDQRRAERLREGILPWQFPEEGNMNTLPRKPQTASLDDPRLASPADDVRPGRLRQLDDSLHLYGGREAPAAADLEETLIVDAHAELRPSQIVEQKLLTLLRGKALPVSHRLTVQPLKRGTNA
jgi:hypothetical protein